MDGYIDQYEKCQEWKKQFRHMLAHNAQEGIGQITYDSVTAPISFKRTLSEHEATLGVNLFSEIERMMNCTRVVTLAEIGCGRGDALLEAKKRYRERVRTLGIDLLRIPAHGALDEFVELDFEEQLPSELEDKAHIAFSNYVFRYFHDPLIGLQNAQKLLKHRGVAYIDIFSTKLARHPDMNARHTLKLRKSSTLPTYA